MISDFELKMAPKRSQAQKNHLANIRALRVQEGGSGSSVLSQNGSEGESLEIQKAVLAKNAAELALENAQTQLEIEISHSKDLYRALRVEKQKVSRVKAAKTKAEMAAAEAQSSFEQLEDQFEQLTFKNEELEMSMSKLLEKWADEKQIAKETLYECRKKIRALRERCRRAPEILEKAVQKAQIESQRFSLMEKGVYTNEARDLCRILVHAGCSQELVGDVIEEILVAANIHVIGPTMSGRTVARSILEGGIMADIQMGHEISKSEGLTVSGDGTTHKNIGYESRHINMLVSTSDSLNGPKHQSRLVGVDSATDHSSQTQADGWKSKITEKLDFYNRSPLAKRSQTTLQLADFFARLQGMNSDHANDQKKLALLLKEIKNDFFLKSLGEEELISMEIPNMINFLSIANAQKIADVGGHVKWNMLSEAEKLKADAKMVAAIVYKLGCKAYTQLPEDEKKKADSFIWVGCAMHKDMNCFKGGNEAMKNWWLENDILGPLLLANKDNAAVLEQAEDADDYTAIEQRAYDNSSGGGVKLTNLAGMVFNNKSDKIGQHDVHQQFFSFRGIRKNRFPDTNNTRFQSHSLAAAELLTTLALYVEFMEWIKDGKDKPEFTNIEKNIYYGLQDVPTQTELAVLTLYAQAISHPYMRSVRGPGTEQVNMLNLGPLHLKVQQHMEAVISHPKILLPSYGSYQTGTMDGKPWQNPEAIQAICELSPSFPHLESVLVAFFKGALVTWKRFTSEFGEGGQIDQATAEEKEKASMPPTNDVNEGALGAVKSYLRRNPNATMHYYNALAMFKFNRTAAFVKEVFIAEDYAYARKEARKKDGAHLEKERKAALIAYKDLQIAKQKEKLAQRTEQRNMEEARLANIQQLKDINDVDINMTVAQLKDQLEIYRGLVDGIPLKSHLKTKAVMVEALKVAITKHKEKQVQLAEK